MRGEAKWGVSLSGLARLRQGTYRLLSALLRYPDQERLAPVPQAACYLRRRSPWAARLAFYGPWDSLLSEVGALKPATVRDLQVAYSHLFIGNAALDPIPLCESAYVNPLTMAPGQVLARVEAAYAASGLRLLVGGESPDHAAVELEFLSFLCGQEAEAWQAREDARKALGRERGFLDQHLSRWVPSLAAVVAARDGRSIYARATQVAAALVAHDADFASALARRLDTATVSRRPRLAVAR